MVFTGPRLADVQEAAVRIASSIRRTPLLRAASTREPLTSADLWLKLECLQPTGSFKVRGASNRLLTTADANLRNGIVTASGGNHGLAVARAAAIAGVPGTIFVPDAIAPEKVDKLKGWKADVRIVGRFWDEANHAAMDFAATHDAAYFHPFADPAIIAGQGTVALEILEDLPDLDVLLVAIGGGGLMAGIATVVKALKPSVRLIGIEPVGAPTLKASRTAGHVVTLPEITTKVATMACGRTDEGVFAIVDAASRRSCSSQTLICWMQLASCGGSSGWLPISAVRPPSQPYGRTQ